MSDGFLVYGSDIPRYRLGDFMIHMFAESRSNGKTSTIITKATFIWYIPVCYLN